MGSAKKPYFPMFVDLSDKKVIVAGAGTIAKRRIRALADFTGHLVVIAPEVNRELKDMESEGRITILRKVCAEEDIRGASLVIAATNDGRLNQEIYAACRGLGIPANVCNDKSRCDFYFPGIAMNDSVVVGVNSGGHASRRARGVLRQIQELLEDEGRTEGQGV